MRFFFIFFETSNQFLTCSFSRQVKKFQKQMMNFKHNDWTWVMHFNITVRDGETPVIIICYSKAKRETFNEKRNY